MKISGSQPMVHPEGKILLLNGLAIDGYAKVNDNDNEEEEQEIEGMEHPTDRRSRLLYKYAWDLYDRRNEIYADSRFFLAPLDAGCGLAYTCKSGIGDATLGVWLEWWESLDVVRIDENGNERLICFFGGSPLSGNNSCGGITRTGERVHTKIRPFYPVWSTFIEINERYDLPKTMYQAFTFEEVLESLGLQV